MRSKKYRILPPHVQRARPGLDLRLRHAGLCRSRADLIQQASESGIPVIPDPVGPLHSWLRYPSWISKWSNSCSPGSFRVKTEERQRQLLRYKDMHMPIILMDAPYRLAALLEEAADTFVNRTITLACNLTLPNEHIWRGTIAEIQKRIGKQKRDSLFSSSTEDQHCHRETWPSVGLLSCNPNRGFA